jgi:hypothetical protein
MPEVPSYFLIAVSNRANVELCIRYGTAGFTSSLNGLWTFCEVREGDIISFLYGARAHNLYEVIGKTAIANASGLPPWPDLTFVESGKTYSFPYRLRLKLLRHFSESLVRPEFAYVAENLLLRAGYAKTHFQADQTTLQAASQLGHVAAPTDQPGVLQLPKHEEIVPLFLPNSTGADGSKVFGLRETFLQSAIRAWLKREQRWAGWLDQLGIDRDGLGSFEVLGERALSQGHVDILLKQAIPIGTAKKVAVEVKRDRATLDDLAQLIGYVQELGQECIGASLIASGFPKGVVAEAKARGISLVGFSWKSAWNTPRTFAEIVTDLELDRVA